jgi:hypothetical protein
MKLTSSFGLPSLSPDVHEHSFTVIFLCLQIFRREIARKTLRECVRSGSGSENRLRNVAG